MSDTDVLLGGFGLFGGRGEYYGRIKVRNYDNTLKLGVNTCITRRFWSVWGSWGILW